MKCVTYGVVPLGSIGSARLTHGVRATTVPDRSMVAKVMFKGFIGTSQIAALLRKDRPDSTSLKLSQRCNVRAVAVPSFAERIAPLLRAHPLSRRADRGIGRSTCFHQDEC